MGRRVIYSSALKNPIDRRFILCFLYSITLKQEDIMALQLPLLPYEKNALEPHISQETLEFHYGKHHKTYLDKLNLSIQNTSLENESLESIIKQEKGGVFNNAAQTWNHTFYWNSLSPQGGGTPHGTIQKTIEGSFGSFENFKKEFTKKACTLFGSGWVWLVKNQNGIEITTTSNAGCPLTEDHKPLLTCDVWEHAYYIDYRNARPKYLESFWKIVNWDWANKNLE